MYKSIPISQLKPNPYRNIDEYPLVKDKIDELMDNFSSTGFWGNIVARPSEGGGYEIAYGHHRLEALKRKYKGRKEVEIIVRKLSNDDMLRMMVQENSAAFGTNALVELGNIEQTIDAAAKGDIKLPVAGKRGPSKTRKHICDDICFEYTVMQVAQFLGKTAKQKGGVQPNEEIKVGFVMLDALADGILTRKQLQGLSRQAANEIAREATRTKREQERIARDKKKKAEEARKKAEQIKQEEKRRRAEQAAEEMERQADVAEQTAVDVAKKQASESVRDVKAGRSGLRDVRESAAKTREALRSPKEQKALEAKQHFESLSRDVSKLLNPETDKRFASFVELLHMDCGLNQEDLDSLRKEVDALSNRAAKFSKQLRNWCPPYTGNGRTSKQKLLAG